LRAKGLKNSHFYAILKKEIDILGLRRKIKNETG
jgi:hypothetical protein